MTPLQSIPNKDLKGVCKDAVERGWECLIAGKAHFALRNGPHRVSVASSPSDSNAHHNLARRLRKCEQGRCEHSTVPAVVLTPRDREARIAADRERNEQKLRDMERQMLTSTHTPIVRPTPTPPKERPVKAKATRNRGPNQSTVKAIKWTAWYLGANTPVSHKKLIAEGIKAGHKEATVKRAMRELGVRVESRGPGVSALVHSPVENTLEAHTPATPSPSPSTEPENTVSGDVSTTAMGGGTHDRASAREWARLEGMAIAADAVLGKDVLLAQVLKVRALIEEGS